MASPSVTARPVGRPAPDLHRRLLLSGILFGVGVAAFVDEVVLHQLLHWHHFYDLSTAAVGLVSDGLFHAFGWFAAVAGLFLFADVRRRGGPGVGRWWPAVLIGAGAFQAWDGTVQHKLMRIHQIRYEVIPTELQGTGPYAPVDDILVYDLVWMAIAIAFLVIGTLAWRRGSRRAAARSSPMSSIASPRRSTASP
mgnify:FL=1